MVGDCPGSWTWTYQGPDADAAEAQWPASSNYGACDEWLKIGSGRAVRQAMELTVVPETGGEWRIRLQVYTQPEIIDDAGGGPVHAVYVF